MTNSNQIEDPVPNHITGIKAGEQTLEHYLAINGKIPTHAKLFFEDWYTYGMAWGYITQLEELLEQRKKKSRIVSVVIEMPESKTMNCKILHLGNDEFAQAWAEWDYELESNPHLFALDSTVYFTLDNNESLAVGTRLSDGDVVVEIVGEEEITWVPLADTL